MPLLAATNLGKHYGARTLFSDASFALEPGERVGLIGANGTGKTTIFRIILGLTDCDGTLARRKDLRIATLDQDPQFAPGATVREAVMEAVADVADLERRMRDIHDKLAAGGDDTDRLLTRLAALETQFEGRGGYELENRADRMLDGVGFPKARHGESVETLSGGERNRVAFARVLMVEPDLWLLDEPTNHLDLDGILFLERMLVDGRASAIIVSHDRRFLDDVTTRTWELEGERLFAYPGSYSRARDLRGERIKAESRAFEQQQDEIAKQESFIQRYQAGQRARQATGRKRRLERLERLERPADRARVMALNLPSGETPGFRVLRVNELAMGYGGRTLFTGLSFEIERGETLGIVGPNGAGKTTLLRLLTGEQAPARGETRWGERVRPGVLEQRDDPVEEGATPFSVLRAAEPRRTDRELRSTLGAMLFRGDEVEKPVSALSGGERRRLALVRMLLEGRNVLLLDEPTNHLDVPSREALELALSAYEGTLIVVSHDRYFLDQLADRVLWIEDGEWHLTTGGFAEALEARMARPARPAPPSVPKRRPLAGYAGQAPIVPADPYAKLKTTEIEERIIDCEERLRELQMRYADPAVYRDASEVAAVKSEIAAVEAERSALEREYARRG